eukprot:ctg_90.g41
MHGCFEGTCTARREHWHRAHVQRQHREVEEDREDAVDVDAGRQESVLGGGDATAAAPDATVPTATNVRRSARLRNARHASRMRSDAARSTTRRSSACVRDFAATPFCGSPAWRVLLLYPRQHRLLSPNFFLELKHAIHERFRSRRAARDVNVDGYDPIAPPHHRVTIVIIPATIRARAHAHHPARLGHLVVHLAQRRGHFVGERAGHDHHVALAGRRSEDDTEAIKIVPPGSGVHHLHRAARQSKRHRPHGAAARPVHQVVKFGHHVLQSIAGHCRGEELVGGGFGRHRRRHVVRGAAEGRGGPEGGWEVGGSGRRERWNPSLEMNESRERQPRQSHDGDTLWPVLNVPATKTESGDGGTCSEGMTSAQAGGCCAKGKLDEDRRRGQAVQVRNRSYAECTTDRVAR